MSSTFSSSGARQLGVGVGARDERVAASSTETRARPRRPPAAIATICWASTSSALRGTTVGSIRPSRISRATTAHSSRSARNFGKIRPLLVSPTPWPARPMRCRPRATDFGDSTCSTRSTAPMSMPSSSDARRDQARQLAGLEQLLDDACAPRARASRGARARSRATRLVVVDAAAFASSLSRSASRSAPRRLLTNTIVERVLLDELQELGVDRRPDRAPRRLAARDVIEAWCGRRPP